MAPRAEGAAGVSDQGPFHLCGGIREYWSGGSPLTQPYSSVATVHFLYA